MSTKFVSKNSNYMLVLKPGIEGNRNLGTHAVPGLYIKFISGLVDVKEESIVKMLREHPGYGTDFMEVKSDEVDPYADSRNSTEPDHVVQEMKYGHAEKAVGSVKPTKLSPALKKFIEAEALKMIPGILEKNPSILKNIIVDLASDMKSKEEPKAETKVKTPDERKEEIEGKTK